MADSFTIFDHARASTVEATTRGGRVLLSSEALQTSLGWELKPEGFCRGEVCVPVREGSVTVQDGEIDLAAFAEHIGRAIAIDVEQRSAYVGASAAERGATLSSLVAPDFTLPDLDGKLHSLSEHRGKKVLLVAYASW